MLEFELVSKVVCWLAIFFFFFLILWIFWIVLIFMPLTSCTFPKLIYFFSVSSFLCLLCSCSCFTLHLSNDLLSRSLCLVSIVILNEANPFSKSIILPVMSLTVCFCLTFNHLLLGWYYVHVKMIISRIQIKSKVISTLAFIGDSTVSGDMWSFSAPVNIIGLVLFIF